MQPLVLIGGGGHAAACIDVILATGQFSILGILDAKEKVGHDVMGIPIIGTDEDITTYANSASFLITFGQFLDMRSLFYQKYSSVSFATVISPFAYVSKTAFIGKGSIVMHHAVVNAKAVVQNNVIVNTMALVEHDTVVENHVHLATKSVCNGHVHVGEGSLIGSGAVVLPSCSITKNTVIAAGAVVNRSIEVSGTYAGCPAEKIK